MKKYSKYKDSGIEWLGEIPEHWRKSKLKYIVNLQGRIGFRGYTVNDLVSEGEGALTLGAKHISVDNKIYLKSPEFISWDKYYESPEIMVQKGDILLTQRGTLGKVALLKEHIGEATINPSMVLLNQISCNNTFLYYYFNSNMFTEWIKLSNTATAVPMISQAQLSNIEIVMPSLNEQSSIASFLDHKSTQIDTLIEKKEQLVEKLTLKRQAIINEAVTKGLNPDVPMKDSGIEWLGVVPEHWSITKLNYVSDIFGGATPKSNIDNYWGGEVNWVTPDDLGKLQGNIIKSTRRTLTEEGLSSCSASIVPKGSIILSSRAPIGHLGILEIEACTNQGCKSFVPKDNMHNYYLYYYLLSAKTDLQRLGTGSTFTEISTSTIKNYRISLPPFAEQQTIVFFLDHKTTQIDNLIEKINTSIDKLKRYRQSLISEAVTGKIDLRDWEQTDNK